MPVRSGRQYIQRLKEHPREVWVHGERVHDVTEYPAFRRPVLQLAGLYDMQLDPAFRDILTYVVLDGNERAGTSYLIPQSYEDLVLRRNAFRVWAEPRSD